MKIEKFEDLEIWKNAQELIKRIYELTKNNIKFSNFKERIKV